MEAEANPLRGNVTFRALEDEGAALSLCLCLSAACADSTPLAKEYAEAFAGTERLRLEPRLTREGAGAPVPEGREGLAVEPLKLRA